jgi:steroid delta-isomerase-like uncharacterized protein
MSEAPVNDLHMTAHRWMDEIWRPGDLSSFDELHAQNFVDHSPAGRADGREAYRQGIIELFTAFPDFTAAVEDLLLEPRTGKAVLRWSATGTQRGAFLGIPASGRTVHFRGIEILRVEAGRIQERWGEWDGLSLLEQMRGASDGI